MYMDNICTSVRTKEEVKNPVKDVDEMLAEKGFKVKGWQSKEPLTYVTSQMSKDTNILENVNKEKVLGMVWHRNLHEFSYRALTKEMVLSQIAKIFNPIGFASALLVRAKIGMQRL